MAKLVAAFASSHSVMLSADLEDWLTRFRVSDLRMPYFDREGSPCTYEEVLARAPADATARVTPQVIARAFHEVQNAISNLNERIDAARLDVLVVVGDDQYELFKDALMPSIAIYYGESIRNAARTPLPEEDWYRRAQMRRLEEGQDRHYPCHRALALHLIEGLVAREFDVTAVGGLSDAQHEGHAFSFVHRWYLKDAAVAIVPIFLNTYNPPNPPTPRRCVRLGTALKELIEQFPESLRVGVIASGGLSHFVVDEDLDRSVIAALRQRNLDVLANLDPRRLKAGSSEIRNWVVVASAASALDLTWLSYTPAYRTPALTGIGLGFASWN